MNFKEQFLQIYSWHKREFILLNLISIGSAVICHYLIGNSELTAAVCYLIFLKIMMSRKIFSFSPSNNATADAFSWKYLQSLPLSKKELIFFGLVTDYMAMFPLLVWLVAFLPSGLHFIEVKDNLWSLGLKSIALYHVFFVLLSLLHFLTMIQFPRLQFMKNNQSVLFYQRIRNWSIGLCVFLYAMLLFTMLGENVVTGLLKVALSFFSLYTFWFVMGFCLIACAISYRNVLKVWHHEKLAYPKLNWKTYRDIPVMTTALFLTILPFRNLNDSLPSMYKGHSLLRAVHFKNISKIESILKEGADINLKNKYGFSPLMVAAHDGNLEMFRYLEKKGARREGQIQIKNDVYHSDMNLFLTAIDGKNPELVEYLIKTSDKTILAGIDRYSALHLAAYNCQDKVVDLLVDHGADVNKLNKAGHTPLHNAAKKNCFGAVVSLIEHGADPLLKNKKGELAMDLLGKNTKQELAYFLEKKTRAPAGKSE